MQKTAPILTGLFAGALTVLAAPLTALADDVVRVDSLDVKERIKSIEQINVTAEKPRAEIAPESQRVAEILKALEEVPGTVDADEPTVQSD